MQYYLGMTKQMMTKKQAVQELTSKGYELSNEQTEALKSQGYAFAYNSVEHTAVLTKVGNSYTVEYFACYMDA